MRKPTTKLIVGVDALCRALGMSQSVFYKRAKDLAKRGIIRRHPVRDLWCADRETVEKVMRDGKL